MKTLSNLFILVALSFSSVLNAQNVGIGTATPATKLDVDGAITLRPSGTITNVTANNTPIAIGNLSYIRITSNSISFVNRQITFTPGLSVGQLLTVEYAATNSNKIMITNNVALSGGGGVINLVSGAIVLGNDDGYYKVVRFIWNGTDWLQEGVGPVGKIAFSSTGTDQYWTVPSGIYSIEVKAWGAGGGGACFSNQASGGSGAFINGRLTVTPGESLTIIVGGNGNCSGVDAYGGGGHADANDAAGGGGHSSVARGGTELCTAGAGGGAGDENGGEKRSFGGYGGVTTGGYGGYENDDCNNINQRGAPGTQVSGGVGGVDPDCGIFDAGGSNGENGGYHFGGDNNFVDNYQGGGGGSGYYGGGAGSSDDGGGGGGGSSYTDGFYTIIGSANGSSNNTGGWNTAGGAADPDYAESAGRGGASNNVGAPGRVVIIW